mmetsp:Transcript_4786/g.9798  ORF Transcript_4786/g.9798 Transcript_4786/m.9798 type:complete len:84 (-) Transcript_4786:2-253(-)
MICESLNFNCILDPADANTCEHRILDFERVAVSIEQIVAFEDPHYNEHYTKLSLIASNDYRNNHRVCDRYLLYYSHYKSPEDR